MITSDRQTSQITSNSNLKPLNLLLCDVIFLSLPGQYDISSFKMANFQVEITPGNQTSKITPNWDKRSLTISRGLSENLSLQKIFQKILISLLRQSDIPCFTVLQFSIRWVAMEVKLLKSHQIQTKTSN